LTPGSVEAIKGCSRIRDWAIVGLYAARKAPMIQVVQ
jgi:hypothetical protein